MDPYMVMLIHRKSKGRLRDILQRKFLLNSVGMSLRWFMEQIPGEHNPVLTSLCDVQFHYTHAWTGYWFFTDTTVIKLPRNTVDAKH